eukprot:Awhi_evm1s9218
MRLDKTSAKKRKKKNRSTRHKKELDGLNILICDDNDVSIKLITTLLSSMGATCFSFSSATDLLQYVENSFYNFSDRARNHTPGF